MKLSHLILVGILLISLIGGASAALGHYSWTSGLYTIEVWNNSAMGANTTTWSVPATTSSVEYLVVGGGGGGGGIGNTNPGAGGGGAGGYLTATNFAVTPGGNVSITVGTGGAGGLTDGTNGFGTPSHNGTASIFSTVTSFGGGWATSSWSNGTNCTPAPRAWTVP